MKKNDINDCTESFVLGIYQKIIKSLSKIKNKFDFYIRTNLSTFIIFEHLIKRLIPFKNIKKPLYLGEPNYDINNLPPWNKSLVDPWSSGTCIILNNEACNILIKNGYEKKYYNSKIPDDVLIGKVFIENGIKIDKIKSKHLNYSGQVPRGIEPLITNINDIEKHIELINKDKFSFIRLKGVNINIYLYLLKYYYNL